MSSVPAATEDTTVPLGSRLWWTVPGIVLVLLVLVAITFGGGSEKVGFGTSYDSSAQGFRGVYLVLEELGYPVERTRRPNEGQVRWVLFPAKTASQEAKTLDDWVQRGGCALLALEDAEFAEQFGFSTTVTGGYAEKITETTEDDEPVLDRPKRVEKGKSYTASAPDVARVFAGSLTVKGPAGGQGWGQIEGQPLVTIYKRGKGELWLLNRPDVFLNANVRQGDNAVLACRLAEAMLAKRPGGRLAFDEYYHGFKERPNVFELLFTPPVLAATLESLFLTVLALWHFGVRFGSVRPAPPAPRRSKEEFLDAMAELLTRKGDSAEAFRTVRNEFLHRLEKLLGLPPGTPVEETVREAAQRRGVKLKPLLRLLTASAPPEGRGAEAFLDALLQLEDAANECFESRTHTR